MKAKVKATGQIVTLDSRCNVTEVVKGGHPRMWTLAELELEDDPDYWTRLEHQYAGMAMRGLCMNDYCECVGADDIATDAVAIAHALIQKLKEKEERK